MKPQKERESERNEYRVKEKRRDRRKSPKVIANDGCGGGKKAYLIYGSTEWR